MNELSVLSLKATAPPGICFKKDEGGRENRHNGKGIKSSELENSLWRFNSCFATTWIAFLPRKCYIHCCLHFLPDPIIRSGFSY